MLPSVHIMRQPATPETWLFQPIPEQAHAWLREQIRAIAAAWETPHRDRVLAIAYAQVARHVPRSPLGMAPAPGLLNGWSARDWTTTDAARAFLLATLPEHDPEALVAAIDNLVARADLAEAVTIYRALPFFAHPQRWIERAAEGVRSNIRAVYDAVAFDNPYPAQHLGDDAWNQMVLKCFFLAAPSHRILGLEQRSNPDLARMLTQYAHERWAASRPVPVGLWRCVAPHADSAMVADLLRARGSDDLRQRQAATLALRQCPHPDARAADTAETMPSWADLEGDGG
jgi:hypothetical protein